MRRTAPWAILLVAPFLLATGQTRAAEMSLGPPTTGSSTIYLDGEITADDAQRFNDIAQRVTKDHPKVVMVVLSGPGGNLIAGLAIGTIIHEHGWLTFVDGGATCESVCGYIWLAGTQRGATKTSYIGFHAAYDPATQKATGAGNAVLGSYLTKMGLGYEAIAYLTTPDPTQMKYLSAEAAAKYRITLSTEPGSTVELPSEASLAPAQSTLRHEGGVIPPENPEVPRDYTPPCSPDRLRLAQRYKNLGVDYQLRAMELCPREMCPQLGTRLMQIGPTKWGMSVARLCPQL